MTRALEDKDQTLAEAAPVIREQQRQARGAGLSRGGSTRTSAGPARGGNSKVEAQAWWCCYTHIHCVACLQPRTVTSTVSNVTFGASQWRY
jgi:hypothetical protein